MNVLLSGAGGGQWTVNLHEGTVARGLSNARTAEIAMSADDFTRMTQGVLDVDAASRDGRIKVQGRPDDIVAFGMASRVRSARGSLHIAGPKFKSMMYGNPVQLVPA